MKTVSDTKHPRLTALIKKVMDGDYDYDLVSLPTLVYIYQSVVSILQPKANYKKKQKNRICYTCKKFKVLAKNDGAVGVNTYEAIESDKAMKSLEKEVEVV